MFGGKEWRLTEGFFEFENPKQKLIKEGLKKKEHVLFSTYKGLDKNTTNIAVDIKDTHNIK